jgi:hypothetical protein
VKLAQSVLLALVIRVKSPDELIPFSVRVVPDCAFLKVTVLAALLLPTVVLEKLTGIGLAVTGVVPLPLRAIVGAFNAFGEVTRSRPDVAPNTLGVEVTLITQELNAGTVLVQPVAEKSPDVASVTELNAKA